MIDPRDIIIPDEAVSALEHGNKIEAIKIIRERTGAGLKEAKDAADAYMQKNPSLEGRYSFTSSIRGGYNIFLLLVFLIGAVVAYLFWPGKP